VTAQAIPLNIDMKLETGYIPDERITCESDKSIFQSPAFFYRSRVAATATLTNHTSFQLMGDKALEKESRVEHAGLSRRHPNR